jgi:hypothetical protein
MTDTDRINWLAEILTKAAIWNARKDQMSVKIDIGATEHPEHERLIFHFRIHDPVDLIIDAAHDDFRLMLDEARRQWKETE